MEGRGGECGEELSKTMGPVALSVLVASNELHSTKLGVMTDAFWQPGELMKACHQVQVGTPLIMDSAELQKVPPPHFAFVWAWSFFVGGGEGQLEKCTKREKFRTDHHGPDTRTQRGKDSAYYRPIHRLLSALCAV